MTDLQKNSVKNKSYKSFLFTPSRISGNKMNVTISGCVGYNDIEAEKYICEIDFVCQHDYIVNPVEPSCTKEGYTTHTCSICGHSFSFLQEHIRFTCYCNN